jgi:hypothetical protein
MSARSSPPPRSLHESGEESVEESWVEWFCSLRGHEFFCHVDRYFLDDPFNLIGLSTKVKNYDRALKEVLDVDDDDGFSAFLLVDCLSFRISACHTLMHFRRFP